MAGLDAGDNGGDEEKNESSVFDAAVEVYAKLKDLRCPFLHGLYITEPATIRELLCTPSKYRLEILEWLYIRVYPAWKDKVVALKGAPVEVKIREMVKLGSDLLLCGPQDDRLLQGRDCAQKQLHFMDQLLTAGQSLASRGARCPSAEEDLEDIREKNEVLLVSTLAPSRLQWLLSPSWDPWPLDVQPLLCGLYDSGRIEPQPHSPLPCSWNWSPRSWQPSVVDSGVGMCAQPEQDEVESLALQLHETTLRLESLRTGCLEQHKQDVGATLADAGTLDQTLRLVTSDFHQLSLAFLEVCEHELATCATRPEPSLHPCGPIIQAVEQVLSSYSQLLKVVMEVTATSGQGTELAQWEHLYGISNSTVPSLATKMEALLEKYKDFGEMLSRHTGTWDMGTELGRAVGK